MSGTTGDWIGTGGPDHHQGAQREAELKCGKWNMNLECNEGRVCAKLSIYCYIEVQMSCNHISLKTDNNKRTYSVIEYNSNISIEDLIPL